MNTRITTKWKKRGTRTQLLLTSSVVFFSRFFLSWFCAVVVQSNFTTYYYMWYGFDMNHGCFWLFFPNRTKYHNSFTPIDCEIQTWDVFGFTSSFFSIFVAIFATFSQLSLMRFFSRSLKTFIAWLSLFFAVVRIFVNHK